MAALVFGPLTLEDLGSLHGAATAAVLPFYQETIPLAEDQAGSDLEEEALLASDAAVAAGRGHHIVEVEVLRNTLPVAYVVVVVVAHQRIVGEEHISAVVVVRDAGGQKMVPRLALDAYWFCPPVLERWSQP
jgi:hypothetical protein